MLAARYALNGIGRVHGHDLPVQVGARSGAWRRRLGAERPGCAHPSAEREHGGEKDEGAFFGWCGHAR
jgi:hypothetical protein